MAKVLHGDAGGNQLNASADKTQVYGLKGNDTLISDGKSDVLLVGGGGDDSLIVLGGEATLSGGEGADTFELNYSADKKVSAVIEDFEPSKDKIVVKFDGATAPQLSSVASGNDVVWKDADGNFNVTLKSVRENDYYDGAASTDDWDAWEAWKVLERTNQVREDAGLAPLTLSQGLMSSASIRAQEITSQGQDGALTNHTRPNGTNFSTVLNNKYSNPGENLDGGARTPAEVLEDWMNSTAHSENILSSSFQKMGLGYVYNDSDVTNHRWYWAQMFADNLRSPETVSAASLLSADIEINSGSNFIQLTEGNDTRANNLYGATIDALSGNDSITNSGLNVSISGGADDDTILSGGSFATIAGNAGNDLISLSTDSKENVIEYSSGDGNDSVSGMNSTDTLKILDDEYTPATVGNNIVVAVGSDSITLTGAVDLDSVNIEGTRSNRYVYTDANERINNSLEGATIDALGGRDILGNASLGTGAILDGGAGDDTINNNAANVSINGGEGDDSIDNDAVYVSIDTGSGDGIEGDSIDEGSNVTINGGAGSDSISNHSALVSIFGGGGNDSIYNDGNNVTIDAGAGNDLIYNDDENASIVGSAGDDSIQNSGDKASINGGEGDDEISNHGSDDVTIDSGAGDDLIENYNSDSVTIDSGAGNDSIRNSGSDVSILGGTGNDSIYNDENNVTINAGKGDDSISLNSSFYDSAQYNLIEYNVGDGNDTIWDFDGDDTLSISGGNYVRSTVVSDIIFVVGEGKIILVNAAQLGDFLNVIGTGTEGDEYKGYVEITENNAIYHNDLNHATIVATGENVSISNSGNNVSIVGGEGNDSIYNDGNNVTIDAGAGNDLIYNDGENASINGSAGDDSINNSGENASINGGDGDDTISNSGNDAIIDSGVGDDQINLASDSENNLIVYNVGDGNDLIRSFNDDDTLEINDVTGNYSTQTNGNDIIVNVEDDSITLQGAASLEAANIFINWSGSQGNPVILTESNDIYENGADNVTIQALGGNDIIRNYVFDSLGNLNWGNFVSIDGGDGIDDIYNEGSNVIIYGGAGDDYISNSGNNVSIVDGEGNDSIYNDGNNVTIDGGEGNDNIDNWGDNVSILGGTGNDSIYNDENNVTIDAGAGDDWIYNAYGANSVSINGGAGDDWIYNAYGANSVSINGGDGDDSISNSGDSVTIDSGAGNDSIDNYNSDSVTINTGAGDDLIENYNSDSVTINTGAGDDLITNWNSYNVSIVSGDGNDSIVNGEDDVSNEEPIINAENIDIDNSSYNALIDSGAGNDYIVNNSNDVTIIAGTGDDRISLESGVTGNLIQYTEGDGNDTIWGFDENSSLQIGDGTATYSRQGVGDDIVIRVGEGSITLKDARDKPDHIILGESASSGGTSSGDGGSSSSGDGGSSSSGDGGSSSSGDGGSSSSGDGSSSSRGDGGSSSRGDGGSSNNSGGSSVAGTSTDSSSDNGNGTSGTSSGQNDSRGRSSRSRINTTTTSSTPSTPATSTAFNVSAQLNADTSQQNTEERPKITLNAPTYANNPSGDEVVALIQSGDESFRKLWGSEGNDTLYGGEGVDIFIGSKNQGSLTFRNVSAEDIVYLSDVSLNDLSGIKKENDMVTFSLKTGNTFTIQSTDTVSGAIVLSDLTVHLTHPPKS